MIQVTVYSVSVDNSPFYIICTSDLLPRTEDVDHINFEV